MTNKFTKSDRQADIVVATLMTTKKQTKHRFYLSFSAQEWAGIFKPVEQSQTLM